VHHEKPAHRCIGFGTKKHVRVGGGSATQRGPDESKNDVVEDAPSGEI